MWILNLILIIIVYINYTKIDIRLSYLEEQIQKQSMEQKKKKIVNEIISEIEKEKP